MRARRPRSQDTFRRAACSTRTACSPRRHAGSPCMSLPVPVRVGLWMVVTAVSFGAMVGTVRYLSAEMDVLVLSFWRNVFAAAVLVHWFLREGGAEPDRMRLEGGKRG